MTLGYRLKKERERRNWSQKFVAEKIGITNTVLSNYERDYRDPDTTTLGKLADLYEISTDELLGRSNKLSKNEERDIARDLEKTLEELESSEEALMFDGEPIDEHTKEMIRISLENSMRMAKQLAKQKFTPNKYKKD
ncbi:MULTISPECIES: helix-turn-helix domain-containing protein [Bacillus]|uniref:XRE family transcriptional regulator n=1 Tax=Bacillus wiedmannii TaxID=1890302 RepID=A0ABD6TNA2_9BACI|nr:MULTISPECIES: helix-turn-helix transcriptional regulator [Bacillus cereus group]AFU14444.1 immunity repressor protein [Bacillus thuringiensis MC28]HDR7432657.1 helix-turn-helix transcriptional regulator [Bacillus anthracis]MCP9277013.1 helix-turn-helix transcriptional regulator [Bacillus wiedmannii]MDO8158384.1 helix-turn-helix transcriptional regulator [Bacillus toyonensis]NSL65351.1 helix-turn-helix transcriptional regulator [Bacillus toyonensis]